MAGEDFTKRLKALQSRREALLRDQARLEERKARNDKELEALRSKLKELGVASETDLAMVIVEREKALVEAISSVEKSLSEEEQKVSVVKRSLDSIDGGKTDVEDLL